MSLVNHIWTAYYSAHIYIYTSCSSRRQSCSWPGAHQTTGCMYQCELPCAHKKVCFIPDYRLLHVPKPTDIVRYYKYLGCTMNEFFDYKFTEEKKSESASRTLGSVIGKMIKGEGFPHNCLVYCIMLVFICCL